MGDLNNDSYQTVEPEVSALRIGLAAAILTFLVSGLASANDSTPPDPDSESHRSIAEAQVSTSPADYGIRQRWNSPRSAGSFDTAPPLTRAAEKKVIEEMSPMTWLSGFGQVTVGNLK
jgi:hypothetical protein